MKDTLSDFTKINALLNQKIYVNKYIIDISKAQLKKWQDLGLLENQHLDNRAWSKYALVDILWISIIREAREFGIAISKLIAIRAYLYAPLEKQEYPLVTNSEVITRLSMATIEVVSYATPIFLIIKSNGTALILKDYEYFSALQRGNLINHLAISINKQVKQNIQPLYNEPNFTNQKGLTRDEIQVILLLRSEQYLSVKITKKDGEISIIEASEKIDQKNKIVDILKQHQYQNIEIKNAQGKVVSITRTIRQKVDRLKRK